MKPLALLLGALLALTACTREEPAQPDTAPRLRVVTTLFPLYDFARTIGDAQAEVVLLLPPGVEPHSFEPRPDDLLRISQADLFVYTHPEMEPWAARVAAAVGDGKVTVVDASVGARLLPARAAEQGHDHGHGQSGAGKSDPHLWLDFANAQVMVANLAAAMGAADPANAPRYQANAARLVAQLEELDTRYRTTLAGCPGRVLIYGGHFAFGYLARRYDLEVHAAAALSPDAEPTPARLAALITLMRRHGLHALFSEELVEPRIAATIARETGATILPLNPGHNLGRDDLARGTTFVALMERNLAQLARGLGCP